MNSDERKQKAPTFKDVARLSGVGLATISRVVNRNGPVSDETRKKVEKALSELGYRHNAAARAFRTGTSKTIGVVLPVLQSSSLMTGAIEQDLQNAGYVMLLASSNFEPENDVRLIELMLEKRVDGLILMPSDDTNLRLHEAIRNLPVPVVVIDRDLPFFVPTVYREHYQVMREAVRILSQLGHRHIGMVTGTGGVRTARERLRGFLDEAKADGLTDYAEDLISVPNSARLAYKATMTMMNRADPPTALIAGGDNIFVGMLRAVRELGLAIGRDISIIGSDGQDFIDVLDPPFTMLLSQPDVLGQTAVRMILAQLTGDLSAEDAKIMLPSRILQGRSCSAPPSIAAPSPT